jgi:hypothetical protein
VGLAGPPVAALPLYASREGDVCQTCHVDPNGGGIRNEFGFSYAKNRHSTEPEERWASMTVKPKLNDWITLGLDIRMLYDAVHENGSDVTLSTSTFFPMEGQVNLAVVPHEHLTLVASHGLVVDEPGFPTGYVAREIYGMIEGLPGDTYAQAGRFRLPFGLRQDDHTSFTRDRSVLVYDSQKAGAGVEIGRIGSRSFAQFAVVNDEEPFASTRETMAAKAGWADRSFQVAVSGLHRYSSTNLWSLYGSATRGRWTVLGEYVGGTVEVAGNREGFFTELDYRVSRGVNLRGRLDYADTYRDRPGFLERRYTGDVDWTPVPFVQGRVTYHYLEREGARPSQEYAAQLYFPF